MEPNEVHEMHEHAEQAAHNRSLLPVTLSMSILAVLVATMTVLSHRAHTRAVLELARANDAWSYYNTKSARIASYEANEILLSANTTKSEDAEKTAHDKYQQKLEKWKEDQAEQQEKAEKLTEEVELIEKKADHFDFGEVLLEIAVIMTSITLLTNHRGYWLFGLALATAGIVFACMGFLVH